jgi:hypothetical protein
MNASSAAIGAAIAVVAAPAGASADEGEYGILVQGTGVFPRGDVARSNGLGVEVAMMPQTTTRVEDCPAGCIVTRDTDPLWLGLGAFVTIGEDTPGEARRNLYGVHPSVGLGWGPAQWLVGFAAVGLDVLVVTTDVGDAHYAGPTLGADARFGLIGYVGTHFTYQLSASYLAAVAPGVGDNAGGLLVQAALGWRLAR